MRCEKTINGLCWHLTTKSLSAPPSSIPVSYKRFTFTWITIQAQQQDSSDFSQIFCVLELPSIHPPIIRLKSKRNLPAEEPDSNCKQVLSGVSPPALRWCVSRLEAAEMDQRTEEPCCHRYDPFILLYDWRLCECVKTWLLGMPGRRWRAQVGLSRMHPKHHHRGQKTHWMFILNPERDSWNIRFNVKQ